jgi:hydrogenase expression/formation protein HypC
MRTLYTNACKIGCVIIAPPLFIWRFRLGVIDLVLLTWEDELTMCLAVPYVIKEIAPDGSGRAASGGVEVEVRLDLIDAPALGDTVLVHAGFAIQKLDRAESLELAALWDEIRAAGQIPSRQPLHASV